MEKGFKNSCSRILFSTYFFSFFTPKHITTRADRWGRLVGGKFPMPVCPYTHQLDTGIFSTFFYIHIGGDLAAFPRVFLFFFGSYTFWKRVLKIHAVVFFFNNFFYLFYTYTYYQKGSQVGKVGGW